jgi:hypothetical protein
MKEGRTLQSKKEIANFYILFYYDYIVYLYKLCYTILYQYYYTCDVLSYMILYLYE